MYIWPSLRSRFIFNCDELKNANSKYFFYSWNQHAQYRKAYNISRSYLLINKKWYFQKKKFTQLPVLFKKNQIDLIGDCSYRNLQSKLNDYIKKIF